MGTVPVLYRGTRYFRYRYGPGTVPVPEFTSTGTVPVPGFVVPVPYRKLTGTENFLLSSKDFT